MYNQMQRQLENIIEALHAYCDRCFDDGLDYKLTLLIDNVQYDLPIATPEFLQCFEECILEMIDEAIENNW